MSSQNIMDILEEKYSILSKFHIKRFYVSCKGDYIKTAEKMESCIRWRMENTTDFDYDNILKIKKLNILYCVGKSKNENPICYADLDNNKLQQLDDFEHGLKYIIYLFELIMKYNKKTIWIVDFSKFKLLGKVENNPIEQNKSNRVANAITIIKLIQNNYPDMLRRLYVINLPHYLGVMSKIILGIMHPGTKKKITYSSKKTFAKKIGKQIDLDNLSCEFGGNLKITDEMKAKWDVLLD
jgi:hypothetical protein